MSITMYGISNSGAGATGGLSFRAAILHVSAPVGSTVTISKSGSTAKSLGPGKSHTNSDSGNSEYYFSITPANYGTWTVTATNDSGIASMDVTVNTNEEYDVEITNFIPSDYQPVEYLEANGTQYIITDIPARDNIRTIIEAEPVTASPTVQCVLGGSAKSSFPTRTNATFLGYNYDSSYRSYFLGYNGSWIDIKNIVNANRYTFDISFKSQEMYFKRNGVVEWFNNNAATATTSDTTLAIFARRSGDDVFRGRVYNFLAYDYLNDSNGQCVADFSPCYRKSDNVAGFWDRISRQFYTNAGTGSFVVGPNI